MFRQKRRRLTADSSSDEVLASSDESAGGARQPVKTQAEQARSLFVRSLPSSTTTESLTALFSDAYPLKHATVVLDPLTKQSKGYGFVTFADAADLQHAHEAFNGSIIDGKQIKVEIARPRTRQGQGPEKERHSEGSISHPPADEMQKSSRLIVRNLPWTIKDADQLSLLFRSFGKVKQASIPKRGPGLSAGFGFVLLRGHKNAEKAMKALNGKEIDSRTIAIDWAVDKDTWISLQPETREGGHEDELQESLSSEGVHDQVMSGSDSSNILGNTESNQEEINCDIGEEDGVGNENDESNPISSEQEKQKGAETEGQNVDEIADDHSHENHMEDKSSTLFIRNLPFTAADDDLFEHFKRFGAVRYARIVIDPTTARSKGVGFVCFYDREHVDACIRSAPRTEGTINQQAKGSSTSTNRQSLLQDVSVDSSGNYTLLGRVLQVSRAVDRREAARLALTSTTLREERDKDKRRLYLLSEGSIPASSSLYQQLSQTETKMREDSIRQRQSLIRTNPFLHLSLTRLSVRNLPRNITSKALKALAREAAVGFAKDVKAGSRKQLTKEELSRGGNEMKEAERARKVKGKGIVTQAKVVFEGREGSKVSEESGAGRSRGYGFIEYSSHRWALMGLRWLNGHAVESSADFSKHPNREKKKQLIVEFAIENAQVVMRRRERESKAREHSKLSERKTRNEEPTLEKKEPSKGQLTTGDRRGTKRKHNDSGRKVETTRSLEKEGLANRQKIIGRKRMLRRNRTKSKASNAQ